MANEAPDHPDNNDQPPPKGPWTLLAVSLQMAASIALGAAAGWWIDRHTGWAPWGIAVGGLLGMALGIYLLMREAS